MKKLLILSISLFAAAISQAQDFKKDVATAKASYTAGKLEDAHFALQQTLQQLDVTIGKEVLKSLPAKVDTMQVNTKEDNVTSNVSFVGATVHRTYGKGTKKAEVEVVSNSPMLTALNAFLTNPLLANMGNDGKTKVLKIQGYKSRLTKDIDSETNKEDYRLEIPLNSAMITLKISESNENEMMAFANALPLEKIAKLIQ